MIWEDKYIQIGLSMGKTERERLVKSLRPKII